MVVPEIVSITTAVEAPLQGEFATNVYWTRLPEMKIEDLEKDFA